MRLSPKWVFFGIVAFGLPVALTIGWLLGTPPPTRPTAAAPTGAGGMGEAPHSDLATSEPVTVAGYASHPPRPDAPTTVPSQAPVSAPPVSAATSAPGTSTPAGTTPPSPPPTLMLPPVPTPTEVLIPPPSPSATSTDSPSPEARADDPAEPAPVP